MNDTYKQLQALENPYPHCQTSAHAWDMAIAEAMRIAAAAPAADDAEQCTDMESFMARNFPSKDPDCWCHKCHKGGLLNQMILCP